ncbi:patatin-like phospholipase family protein [Mycobacterium sp. SM1]|uniref:patatin-like phospholipase family protein n=1 Tax=Mycobacterium sp. SM1 TaxID=2816243 RepID=UPI001BCF4F78|nr:patatin-like phospholipase family protein [Mycobacterium sp. SM1]MBS4730704.1 patatin-like phospholipase family protein [Mycobacterium sp. SM1]
MPRQRQRVAVVLGAAGARGGYEAGALSVLVPRLRAAGCEPKVYLGFGAGAVNAALLTAFAHLEPAEQAGRVLALWHSMPITQVRRSPLFAVPGATARFVGQTLRLPGMRLTHLLNTAPLQNTAPLRRKIHAAVDSQQLRDNIAGKGLTLAVVTTSGDDDRSVVFVERADGVPVPAADDERPIDYVAVRMRPEHVLASAALPVVFPPVRIRKPSGATGWYLDGGLRLDAPLKPALALEADALVIVATHPMRDSTTTPQPGGLARDVSDVLVELFNVALTGRLVEDLRTLAKINALLPEDEVVVTATGRLRRKIPYVLVGPPHREALGRLAHAVLHSKSGYSGGPLARLRQHELRLLARAFEGDGPRGGDLISYLYFDQEFIRASIELGRRDANALFEGLAISEIPWRID